VYFKLSKTVNNQRFGERFRVDFPSTALMRRRSLNARARSFGRYGGVGVRIGFDGSWAYTTSFGNAVKIVPRNGRTFVFSSNKPEEICQIIKKKRTLDI